MWLNKKRIKNSVIDRLRNQRPHWKFTKKIYKIQSFENEEYNGVCGEM